MNRCDFIGNLVEDPNVKTVNGDRSVVKFRIGVNTRFKDKEEATFPNIEAWGQQADLIGKHFVKGDPIFVTCRLVTDSWADKDSGETRYRDKYVLDRFEFLPASRRKQVSDGAEPEFEGEEQAEATTDTAPTAPKEKGGKGKRQTAAAGAGGGKGSSIPFD